MRVLVGCEQTGRVRDAFRARGHDAVSCDIEPTMAPGPHLQCDVLTVLGDGWDLAIFHPDCTYLAVSGLHRNRRTPGRAAKTERALEFVRALLAAPIPHIALENPVSCIGSRIRPPDQTIQPYHFGENASKRTCLWLVNLPWLRPTGFVEPRMVDGRPRWANQTDGGQNRLPPSEHRALLRAATYPGIANAMADQWGGYVAQRLAA